MRNHHYFSEYDDSFDEYTDSIEHRILKDRLNWQHRMRKELYLEYRIEDGSEDSED